MLWVPASGLTMFRSCIEGQMQKHRLCPPAIDMRNDINNGLHKMQPVILSLMLFFYFFERNPNDIIVREFIENLFCHFCGNVSVA